MVCPISEYCRQIRSQEAIQLTLGDFGLLMIGFQKAVESNSQQALLCWTKDKDCALRSGVWEKLGYDLDKKLLLSAATESLADL